jgi:hypothetical protein
MKKPVRPAFLHITVNQPEFHDGPESPNSLFVKITRKDGLFIARIAKLLVKHKLDLARRYDIVSWLRDPVEVTNLPYISTGAAGTPTGLTEIEPGAASKFDKSIDKGDVETCRSDMSSINITPTTIYWTCFPRHEGNTPFESVEIPLPALLNRLEIYAPPIT